MPTVRPTPSPEVISYAVRAGDTLAKIATRFGVTLEQIVEANDIEDPNLIEVGQVLIIPGR
ncbi:MAG TPA: LysM domain-containing protein, partial [Anaerolineae bacterium]|nr:LysM domain-containing protein [Anaerolineae bacterium]